MTPNRDRQILLYDTDCALCSGFVQSILRFEKDHNISFGSLSGETAKKLYDAHPHLLKEDTVIFVQEHQGQPEVFIRSEAVLKVLLAMGGKYRHAGKSLMILPSPLRDLVYRGIAANRKRIFGETDECVLLPRSQQWRALP